MLYLKNMLATCRFSLAKLCPPPGPRVFQQPVSSYMGLTERPLDFHGWPLYSQQNFQKQENHMPTFDQVPLQEAMLKTATSKTAQITQEYLGYIIQLLDGQAGRLQPSEEESVATVRRRLGVAAKLSGD